MSGILLMLVFGCAAVIIVAGIIGVLLFVLRRGFAQGGHGSDHATTSSSGGGLFAWGGSDSGSDGGFWGGDSSGDSDGGGGDSGGDGGGE